MNIPRRHHYIPQFLIKRFGAGKKKHVWVFDKADSRSFRASPNNIAVSRDRYSVIREDSVTSIEPSLSEIEGRCARFLKRILKEDDISVLDAYEKIELSVMLVQLCFRSPNSEKWRVAMVAAMRQRVRELGGEPDDLDEIALLSKEEGKIHSIEYIRELPGKIAPHLAIKYWALYGIENGSQSLLLSDNPVVMHNDVEREGGCGFGVPGVQIYMPISSKRCLAMYCPSLFGGFGGEPPLLPLDDPEVNELIADKPRFSRLVAEAYPPLNGGKLLPIAADNVTFLNRLQIVNSERYLFAERNDFSLAEEMLGAYPRLRVGPRPEVRSG